MQVAMDNDNDNGLIMNPFGSYDYLCEISCIYLIIIFSFIPSQINDFRFYRLGKLVLAYVIAGRIHGAKDKM